MRRKVGQFLVQADDGRQFTLLEYQNFIDVGTKEDPFAVDLGLKELFTSDGERVNVKHDGTYEIVGLSLTLRRTS